MYAGQDVRRTGCMKKGCMKERTDAGHDGYKTGYIKGQDASKCRRGWMLDRTEGRQGDAGLERQESKEARQEGCRGQEIQRTG